MPMEARDTQKLMALAVALDQMSAEDFESFSARLQRLRERHELLSPTPPTKPLPDVRS